MNLYEYVYETLKICEKNLKQDQLFFLKLRNVERVYQYQRN